MSVPSVLRRISANSTRMPGGRALLWAWAALLALVAVAFDAPEAAARGGPSAEGEIGFVEEFALADDRDEALKQLIPGTRDFYYYTCLHLQNGGRLDEVDGVLKTWIGRHGRTGRVREMENRQALLRYEAEPRKSLDFIRRRLNLSFNHQREVPGRATNYPTQLDGNLVSRETLKRRALSRHSNLHGFTDSGLALVTAGDLQSMDRLRDLLRRLKRPDYPDLPALVVRELSDRRSSGFGSMGIHKAMLLDQLDECARLRGGLPPGRGVRDNSNFVNAYVVKLHPNPDVDWQHDDREKGAYLDRLLTFARTLSAAHNSLKAHVLYHKLVHDRARKPEGERYDRALFMEYLKLPRRAQYANPAYLGLKEHGGRYANLGADYGAVTLLPRVSNDEPLVREFLAHFFVQGDTRDAYAQYVEKRYLREVYAETMILAPPRGVAGRGDMEEWYSLLDSPAKFQALKERIDIDFAPTNGKCFSPEEPVEIGVYVKNVKTLIVKVFEINTANYYRRRRKAIDTTVDLDGLVASEEKVHTYEETPFRRVLRRFEFPSLERRGVFVVELIGNGKSSRALLRKGRLRFLERPGVAGHVLTVLDETNRKLEGATVWMAGREYTADAHGEIAIPYTAKPGRQQIVLGHEGQEGQGGFSTLDHFQHKSEVYSLTAGFYVEREALVKGGKAKILVRPALYVNGAPATLKVLEEVTLVIRSTDHEGVSTSKEVREFKLFADRESEYEFKVPDGLSSIAFTLKAKVESMSLGKKQDLADTAAFGLNRIDQSERIEDLHLARVSGGYVAHLLGKTGEPKAGRPVSFELRHRDFRETVKTTLQTDSDGRIELGELDGITLVTASRTGVSSPAWRPTRDRHSYPRTIHGRANEILRVPYMGVSRAPERNELSLIEKRGGTFFKDRFDALAVAGGYVEIAGLGAGDYDLMLKDAGAHIDIKLTDGEEREGYVLSEKRLLEVRNAKPLQIASFEAGDDEVKIALDGASPLARVHVFGTRFAEGYGSFSRIGKPRFPEPQSVVMTKGESGYVSGRQIGDEYRYILDRKYTKKYPGNMLRRPGLLLNPWAIAETKTGGAVGSLGVGGGGAGAYGFRSGGGRKRAALRAGGGTGQSVNLDFLAQPGTVHVNLRPDDNGVVTVPRADLGDCQLVRAVAVDAEDTCFRELALPEVGPEFKDLRFRRGLDPEGHFTEKKQITVLRPGEGLVNRLVIEDITTSEVELFDSLPKLYSLYTALNPDPKLVEFGFVLNWPKLSPEEKRAKYSKHACHELSFFVYKQDPPFFMEVVVPYLRNKKDKTFVDHMLLGVDLARYMKPWAHGRLNVMERALLAQFVRGELDPTAQHVRELYELKPPDLERFNHLFDTAVKRGALETADTLGLGKARKREIGLEEERAAADDGIALRSRFAGKKMKAPAKPRPSRARPGDGLSMIRAGAGAGAGAGPAPGRPAEPAPVVAAPAGGEREEEAKEKADKAYFARDAEKRKQVRQLYRKLEKTKEWVENNYYHLPIEAQDAALVTVNSFWNDYARVMGETGGADRFLSTTLADASRSFPEMMFALALLDLPFDAPEHETGYEGKRLTITAKGAAVAFHKEIKEAELERGTPILVSQSFFKLGDRFRYEGGERFDKYVETGEGGEFVVNTVYGCQIVVTNPTSSPQKLDLLLQVPRGSMPVKKGFYTKGMHVRLGAYSTTTFEYHFYFPEPGTFAHYPVHVAKNERVIAAASPATLNVVEKPTRVDTSSWDYISQNGSEEEVLRYLRDENPHRVKLERIAWRVRDRDFFRRVTTLASSRHVYDNTLWSYGIHHDEPEAVREYLQHADSFIGQCGAYIDTKLVTIDPVIRKSYQHMEYEPLVNARVHRFGKRRKILNDRFLQQYNRLMKVLTYRPELDDDDLTSVAYYMLLQDRVEEGLRHFGRVDREEIASRIQYDYLASYVGFYAEDVKRSRRIASRYREYPVDKWRKRFVEVLAELDEIEGKAAPALPPADPDGDAEADRTRKQTELARTEPGFEFKVESKRVEMQYRNIAECRVNYYLMDIELLFSRNPFVGQEHGEYGGRFSFIRPNETRVVKLPAGKTAHGFDLPRRFHNSNVLVEIEAAGSRKSKGYFSNSLSVQVAENYGQVRVAHRKTGKPLPKVYVKVYARTNGRAPKFYKDGYTDLRGRFDYTSLSTDELDRVGKFSILVLSDKAGGVVREASPPKR